MYSLVVKPRAIEMAKEAYEWYEEQQLGLGGRFVFEMERCLSKLEYQPLLYAKIKKNFRQILLNDFPYVVVFEIFKTDVVIYAVFHTSQSLRKKFKKWFVFGRRCQACVVLYTISFGLRWIAPKEKTHGSGVK